MESIDKVIAGAQSIAITGHVRPDGDCAGSTLGLYNYIVSNYPDIRTDIYLEPIEDCMGFLKNSDKIKNDAPDKTAKYDIFFILDCSDMGRIADFCHDMIKNASKTVCIDHHMTAGDFATVNHILPQISSASEVLYELLSPDKIDRAAAECLYVGIVHDTGVFKYQSTTCRTMEIAGSLMEKGIDFTSIIDDTFFRKSYVQNLAMGRALCDSTLLLDGKLIYSQMDAKTLREIGLLGRETAGIIDQLRFTSGVEVAMFMYELNDGKVKVSMRSVSYVDVNAVANEFGGGGHRRAAGFTTDMKFDEIVTKVAEKVSEQLR